MKYNKFIAGTTHKRDILATVIEQGRRRGWGGGGGLLSHEHIGRGAGQAAAIAKPLSVLITL